MKRTIKILLIASAIALLIAACGGKEPDPTPTPEPPPPDPAPVEPEVSPADTCEQDMVLPTDPGYGAIYCENFEDAGTVMMPLGTDENKWGALNVDVYKGKYAARIEVKRDNVLTLVVPTDPVRDFTFQIDGRLASHSGHPYHSWGVFFKMDEDMENYYYFMVDNNQYYYFQLIRGDRQTNLINGRFTDDLNPLDEGNTITVMCEGDTFTFYINGAYQEDFSDNRLLTGTVGIYSQMRSGTTLDWEFDNIAVYSP